MGVLRILRKIPPRRQALVGGLIVGTGMTLLMLLVLQGQSVLTRAELNAYDLQFTHRGSISPSSQIIVVGLDQTSAVNLAPGTVPPRRYWVGRAITYLCHAGAKAIGVDFSYFAPSVYDDFTKGADTRALAAAIKRCNRVVLNEQWEGAGASSYVAGTQLDIPVSPLDKYAHLGVDNVPPDYDNVIRQAWLLQQGLNTAGQPAFPAVVAAVAEHKTPSQVLSGLPRQMLTNYVGPQTVTGDQQSWYVTPFEGTATDDPTSLDNPAIFRNKIVLIVPAAIVFADTHKTPFGDMFGGFIQANTLNTILQRNPIIPAGSGINNLVLILIGLLTTVIASRFGIWHSVVATVVLMIGYPIVTIVAFSYHNYWLNLPTPELEVILVLAGVMGFRFATEERQKRKAHQKFGQYVKPEIVDIIVNSPGEENTLAGARRPISVLFVDIRGFTAMSERLKPEDALSVLDVYLEQLTESVQEHDGTLDKYVGDEVMAIWNAPRRQEEHALLAVKCGLDMVHRTDKINEQLRAKNMPLIRYGVGVNTGEAIVGEMGSTFRKQYTVIGDSINTGARLCSAAGGGEVIIGQHTWELVGQRLEVEETEPLKLKGKSEPLRTFSVLRVRDSAAPPPEAVQEEPTEPPALTPA